MKRRNAAQAVMEKPAAELKELEKTARHELLDLRFRLTTNQSKQHHLLAEKRRQVARILTRMRQLEILSEEKHV